MSTDLDAAHIFVSREQACALIDVGHDRLQRWITVGEIPTYLITPTDNHRGPGRRQTVFRLADVYAARQRAKAVAA